MLCKWLNFYMKVITKIQKWSLQDTFLGKSTWIHAWKPELYLWNHMVEEENKFHKVVLWHLLTWHCKYVHTTHIHIMHTHRHTIIISIFKLFNIYKYIMKYKIHTKVKICMSGFKRLSEKNMTYLWNSHSNHTKTCRKTLKKRSKGKGNHSIWKCMSGSKKSTERSL